MAKKPKGSPRSNSDLPDSSRDKKKLESEEFTIDMPDVKDIPGQEFVHAPNPREYADTTISSSDEEGGNIWADEDDQDVSDDNTLVSDVERKLLDDSANDTLTSDEQQLRRAELDSTDNEGQLLNEKTSSNSISGSDLDVPGADSDDENEDIGEEDEENNSYSIGGDNNSVNEERRGD